MVWSDSGRLCAPLPCSVLQMRLIRVPDLFALIVLREALSKIFCDFDRIHHRNQSCNLPTKAVATAHFRGKDKRLIAPRLQNIRIQDCAESADNLGEMLSLLIQSERYPPMTVIDAAPVPARRGWDR